MTCSAVPCGCGEALDEAGCGSELSRGRKASDSGAGLLGVVRCAVLFAFGIGLALAAAPPIKAAQVSGDSTYTVQSGDTLYGIAQEVGVSVRRLMEWNDLENTDLQVGQTLRIRPPVSTDADATPPADAPRDAAEAADRDAPAPDTSERDSTETTDADTTSSAPPARYATKTGDTFVGLALRLGTTADSLFLLNDRRTAALPEGETVLLPPRFGPPTHVVQSGETLYSIAGDYGVSVRALRAENNLDPDSLEPGQRLEIPGRRAPNVPPVGRRADPDSTGRVARYPSAFAGRLTASGTTYDPDDFVISHPSLPFGSVVLLSDEESDRHTFARVIDRGPAEEGVLLDVSDAVIRQLDLAPDGSATVALRIVWVAGAAD